VGIRASDDRRCPQTFHRRAQEVHVADVDDLIGGVVGKAEPPNINVGSQKKTAERIFLESLRRQVYEYRNAFNEVERLLEDNKLLRAELNGLDAATRQTGF